MKDAMGRVGSNGISPVIVEWLMGHGIGIAKHYLVDNIKQEYAKFEQAIWFY